MQANITVSLSCLLACIETCSRHGGESNSPAQTASEFHSTLMPCPTITPALDGQRSAQPTCRWFCMIVSAHAFKSNSQEQSHLEACMSPRPAPMSAEFSA